MESEDGWQRLSFDLKRAHSHIHTQIIHTHIEHHRHASNFYKLLYIPQIYTKIMCQLKLQYHNMKRSIINNNVLWEASYIRVTQRMCKPVPSWGLGQHHVSF